MLDYNKNHLAKKLDEKDLENNLLNIFYCKDENSEDENKSKINKLIFDQFINSSKITNQYDIF